MLRTYLFATSLRVVLLPSPPASCERAGRGPPTLPLSSSLFPRKHQERSRVLAPGRRDGPDSSSPRFGCPPPPPAAQHHGRRPAAPRPAIVSRTHPRRAPEASSQRSPAQRSPHPHQPHRPSRGPCRATQSHLSPRGWVINLSLSLSPCVLSLASPHLTSPHAHASSPCWTARYTASCSPFRGAFALQSICPPLLHPVRSSSGSRIE